MTATAPAPVCAKAHETAALATTEPASARSPLAARLWAQNAWLGYAYGCYSIFEDAVLASLRHDAALTAESADIARGNPEASKRPPTTPTVAALT